MQYHTRQQTQGAARYKPAVLIGNWNEDRNVEETVLKDFLAKSQAGTLKIDKFQADMALALAPAVLTVVRNDGLVHFGDVLQLAHCGESAAVLAADTHEQDRRMGEHACAATAAPQLTAPCARNTFILAKYSAPRADVSTTHYRDDVLRYGQKFRIVANAAVVQGQKLDAAGGPRPLHLFSKPVSTTHFAKHSHQQLVGFTTHRDYGTVFKAVPVDPAQRIASEGVEVAAGVPLCLQHCGTSALLCLEAAACPNEFGTERELSCRTVHGNGKKLVLCHEARGALTDTLPSAPAQANHFRFVVGATEGRLPEPDEAEAAVDAALAAVSARLAGSTLGTAGLQQKLLRMDATGSGAVRSDEVQLAFAFVGVQLDADEVVAVQARFGTAQPQVVDVRGLLEHLEGPEQ